MSVSRRLTNDMKTAAVCLLICVMAGQALAAAPKPRLTKPPVGLVAARDFERSGLARVSFDARTKEVSLTHGNVRLLMVVGLHTARLNGIVVRIPAPATVMGGRAMLPAGFVLKALGLSDSELTPINEVGTAQGESRVHGRVLYAGRPLPGAVLRLVQAEDFTFVPGMRARADAAGRYAFAELPEGLYRVYAYVGDNPGYFNRVTAVIRVGPRAVTAPDIHMGRALRPNDPPRGALITPGREMLFTWSVCPHAAEYHLSVIDPSTNEEIFSTVSTSPWAVVPLSRMTPGHQYEWRVIAVDAAGAFLGGSPGSGAEAWMFSLALDQ